MVLSGISFRYRRRARPVIGNLSWRLPGYEASHHLGGVGYLFVRGMAGPGTPVIDESTCGVFSWYPPAGLVVAASDLLAGSR